MTILEVAIDADTEALQAIAESFTNIDVVHKLTAHSLPYRWEVQSIEPSKYLGTIELTPAQICQPDTERRITLRRDFLRILREMGHDR
jgi:hypothetical protein